MAEGARLESVYVGNGIVGSNPTLSANLLRERRGAIAIVGPVAGDGIGPNRVRLGTEQP